VRNYGGDLEIARDVSLFDDYFEVITFEGNSALPYLKYLAGVMLNRLYGMKGVTISRADCVTFSGPRDERIYVQVDGDFLGPLPARVRVVPGALTILVPEEYVLARSRRTAEVDYDTRA
jgi:diacylglycerol kinase family enzyme